MPGKTITATDAARRFSDVLNPVRYQGVEFDTSGRRASRQHRAAPSAALGIRGGVFELFRPLPFDLEVARVHAHLVASLPGGVTPGA